MNFDLLDMSEFCSLLQQAFDDFSKKEGICTIRLALLVVVSTVHVNCTGWQVPTMTLPVWSLVSIQQGWELRVFYCDDMRRKTLVNSPPCDDIHEELLGITYQLLFMFHYDIMLFVEPTSYKL